MSQDTVKSPDWSAIEAQPAFRALLQKKARFITAATLFFIFYYFALLVLVGWFPALMKQPVLGKLNVAYLFALSQFFMAWAVAFFYTRAAAKWDKESAALLQANSH